MMSKFLFRTSVAAMLVCAVACVSCAGDEPRGSGKPHALTTAESLEVLVSSEVGSQLAEAGQRLYYDGDLVVPDLVELLEDVGKVPIPTGEVKLWEKELCPLGDYDMDYACGRVAWTLENITRMDFGFRKPKGRVETEEEIALRLEKSTSDAKTWWSHVAKPYHRTREFLRRVRDCSAPEDQLTVINYIYETRAFAKSDWHNECDDSTLDRRDPGLSLFSVAFYADDMSLALVELLKSDAQERVKESAQPVLRLLSREWGGGGRFKIYDNEVQVEAGVKPEDVLELVKQAVPGKIHIAEGCRLASSVPPGRYRIHAVLDLLYDPKSHEENQHWGQFDFCIYPRTWESEYAFWSEYWKKYHPNWDSNAPDIDR